MTLDEIGIKTGTDKSSVHHNYLNVYESYLKDYRQSNIALIEIGYGGYEFPDRGGEGVRTWYEYFKRAKIISIDIHEKVNAINDRTEFWQGDQTDSHLLKTIIEREKEKEKRILIDDASHDNALTIETFKIVFPMLTSGDLYFVEDAHCSYWFDYFGGCEVPGAKGTTMRFFTELTHQLNAETLLPEYRNEYAGQIEFIHFYKELIVIKKL